VIARLESSLSITSSAVASLTTEKRKGQAHHNAENDVSNIIALPPAGSIFCLFDRNDLLRERVRRDLSHK
jgi:hypothetical protein